MIDARRMEVYSAFYSVDVRTLRDVQADIVEENTYNNYLGDQKVYFFGNGALKCKEVLGKHQNAIFIENVALSAKGMIEIAERKLDNKEFENTAYFEPFYLKDFIAAKPVVKGLY
jgi:tRNA threonylcarbamoyladenosine biosynthesis protein TsaB